MPEALDQAVHQALQRKMSGLEVGIEEGTGLIVLILDGVPICKQAFYSARKIAIDILNCSQQVEDYIIAQRNQSKSLAVPDKTLVDPFGRPL